MPLVASSKLPVAFARRRRPCGVSWDAVYKQSWLLLKLRRHPPVTVAGTWQLIRLRVMMSNTAQPRPRASLGPERATTDCNLHQHYPCPAFWPGQYAALHQITVPLYDLKLETLRSNSRRQSVEKRCYYFTGDIPLTNRTRAHGG